MVRSPGQGLASASFSGELQSKHEDLTLLLPAIRIIIVGEEARWRLASSNLEVRAAKDVLDRLVVQISE